MLSRYKNKVLDRPVINFHNLVPGGITLVYDLGSDFFNIETIEDIVVIDEKKARIAIILYGERLPGLVDAQDTIVWCYAAKSRKVVYFNLKDHIRIERLTIFFLRAIWRQKTALWKGGIEVRVR